MPASEFDVLRAKLWVRFLLVCLDCDVRWLDQSLLLPVTDKTGVFSKRVAPYVFAPIYSNGKNPNGAYWREFNDSGDRFNLVTRVAEHVPRSEQWLLSNFVPYLKDEPPSLSYSHRFLQGFLRSRTSRLVPGTVMRNIGKLQSSLELRLHDTAFDALFDEPTPDGLMLMIAMLHQLAWHRRPDTRYYKECVLGVAAKFGESLSTRRFDNADTFGRDLYHMLSPAIRMIAAWGDRTLPSDRKYSIEDVPDFPILVEDTDEVTDACYCLHLHSPEWQYMNQDVAAKYPWFKERRWHPSDNEIDTAMRVIERSAEKLAASLGNEYQQSLLHSAVQPSMAVSRKEATSSVSRTRSHKTSRRGTSGKAGIGTV
jgi:hypothetical protein